MGAFWFGGWAGFGRGFAGCPLCCSVVRRGRSVGAESWWKDRTGVVAGVGGGVLLGCRVSGDKRRGGVCQIFPGVLRPQFERVAAGWALRFLGRLGGGGLAERAGVFWFGGWAVGCDGAPLGSSFGGVVVAGVAWRSGLGWGLFGLAVGRGLGGGLSGVLSAVLLYGGGGPSGRGRGGGQGRGWLRGLGAGFFSDTGFRAISGGAGFAKFFQVFCAPNLRA